MVETSGTDDLEQFTSDLLQTLDGEWEVLATEENEVTGLPEVRAGLTPAENGCGDHTRVTIRETTKATYVVTGFVGALTEDGEFTRERAIAHSEFEDVPEKDLRGIDAVGDFVRMLAENVEEGVYSAAD